MVGGNKDNKETTYKTLLEGKDEAVPACWSIFLCGARIKNLMAKLAHPNSIEHFSFFKSIPQKVGGT